MAETNGLQVAITADTKQFKKQFEEVQKQLEKFGKVVEKTSKAATGFEQLKSEVGGIKAKLDGFGKKMGFVNKALFGFRIRLSKLTEVGAVFTNAIGGMVAGLAEFGRTLLNSGSMYSRLEIATKMIVHNLGYTDEQYKKWIKTLRDANTYGINALEIIRKLALTGIIRLANSLEYVDARSGKTQKGLTALVLGMKDLGASAAISSSEAIRDLADFIQSGLQSENVDRMLAGMQNLTQEYEQWAEEHGIVNRQLTAQEEAMARMNIVMREANKVWGAYAATYATSGKNISSIKDKLEAIVQTLGGALEPLWRVIFGGLLKFFGVIQAWAEANAETIRNWAITVAAWLIFVARIIMSLLSIIPVVGKYFNKLAHFSLRSAKAVGKNTKGLKKFGAGAKKASEDVGALNDAMKQLAGFDEMNVLEKPSGGGGGGASVETPAIGFGGMNFKKMHKGVQALDDLSDKINKKVEEIQESFRKLTKPFADLWEQMSKVKIFGVPLTDWLSEFGKNLIVVGGAVVLLGSAIGNISAGITALGVAFSKIGITSMGWIGVIVLVIAALVTLYNKNEKFRNLVNKLAKAIINLAKKGWELLKKAFEAIKPHLEFAWNIFKKYYSIQMAIAAFIWSFLSPVIKKLGEIVKEYISEKFAEAKEKLEIVKKFISETLAPAFENLWKGISGAMDKIITSIVKAWSKIKAFLSPIIAWLWGKLVGIWDRVKTSFIKAITTMRKIGATLFSPIKTAFRNGINAIIGFLNGFIWRFNNLIDKINNAGSHIPGFKGISWRLGYIPRMATGGYVKGSTLAEIGEAGREVVLPLDKNTEWADILAQKIGSTGQKAQIVVKIGEETIVDKVVDLINEKTVISNTNILNV